MSESQERGAFLFHYKPSAITLYIVLAFGIGGAFISFWSISRVMTAGFKNLGDFGGSFVMPFITVLAFIAGVRWLFSEEAEYTYYQNAVVRKTKHGESTAFYANVVALAYSETHFDTGSDLTLTLTLAGGTTVECLANSARGDAGGELRKLRSIVERIALKIADEMQAAIESGRTVAWVPKKHLELTREGVRIGQNGQVVPYSEISDISMSGNNAFRLTIKASSIKILNNASLALPNLLPGYHVVRQRIPKTVADASPGFFG